MNEIDDLKPGWQKLPEERLPRPNFFPAGLAFGTTLIFWGLITYWVVLAFGLGIFAVSLLGWVREIRYERNQHQS